MARQSRRKPTGIIATLLVELSALASIFGVAQPAVRNNLWQLLQPTTANSKLDKAAQDTGNPQFTGIPQVNAASRFTGGTPEFTQYASPQPFAPSYVPDLSQTTYPSAYTAQAIVPQNPRNPSGWNPSGYNPMGNYQ